MEQHSLLSNIGLVFIIATLFGFVAKFLKQPLILAYLVAGVAIGPEIGFAWVKDRETIELISEIGLILLLFIIGLEIDLKRLLSAGRTILVTGLSQFLLCVAMGTGLAFLMGFMPGGGNFDELYLAVALALSSTLIVVKLLYDKSELTTLPGRITLRLHSARYMAELIARAGQDEDGFKEFREDEFRLLKQRKEILQ